MNGEPSDQRRIAVFLDRDGTIIEEVGYIVRSEAMRLLPESVAALNCLHEAGMLLVLTTNQAVVARGMLEERQLDEIHRSLNDLLADAGAPRLDGIYACPHHPHADRETYRVDCECRKPKPGMLRRAADDLAIDLAASFMVGDRPTDVAAGRRAGCRSVLLTAGAAAAAPIVTTDDYASFTTPHFACSHLLQAAEWILAQPSIQAAP